MNDTQPYVEAHAQPYIERTYTAAEIAAEHDVTDATVRNRWFEWLQKVAPVQLLKEGKSYTELAHTLFSEFATVDQKERHAWVADAKERYAAEWSSAGVFSSEAVPVEVGGTLATFNTQNANLQKSIALQLAAVDDFIAELNSADVQISQAEMEAAIARGSSRAIQLFQAEEAASAQMAHALRQRRMGGNQQS